MSSQGLELILNPSTGTPIGGANNAIIKNDFGSLYLYSSNLNGISIASGTGAVGIGTSTLYTSNMLTVQGNTVINGTLTASNLNILGTTEIVNAYESHSSNLVINNLGTGPALSVTQSESTSQPLASFYAGGVPSLFMNSSGSVGIGTTNPAYALDVSGSVNVSGRITTSTNTSYFGPSISVPVVNWMGAIFGGYGTTDLIVCGGSSGGGATIGAHNSTLTAWAPIYINNVVNVNYSDSNLKTNIQLANKTMCYDTIKALPLVRFNYNSNIVPDLIGQDKTLTGVLAQDLEKVFPKSVYTLDSGSNIYPTDGTKGINTDQVFYTMIGAVQQLMGVVEEQKICIDRLTSNVALLMG